jgi:hypothetical protein
VTGSEGGRKPSATWEPGNTVLVGVAQARDIEFIASNPGDWMIHCHLPHHMMNSMMDLLSDRPISTSPLSHQQADEQMQLTMTHDQGMTMTDMTRSAKTASDAGKVPGFPQDGFMDMSMDEAAGHAPEFMELPPDWSVGMQGMMTLLRVMPPEKYQRYLSAKERAQRSGGAQ